MIGRFNIETWLAETKAHLPEIEAAGHQVKFAGAGSEAEFDLHGWLSETNEFLPNIEAAGHKIVFAPDWAKQFWDEIGVLCRDLTIPETTVLDFIRSRARPVNQEQPQ